MKRERCRRFFDKSLLSVTDPNGTKLNLIWLAIPIFFENACTNLIGLLQTSMASYYENGYFVLVTSVPNQLLNLIISLLAMVPTGLSILLSIQLGQNKTEKSKRLIGAALYSILILSVVVAVTVIFLARPLVVLMGLGEEHGAQVDYAALYLQLRVAVLAATNWVLVFTSALRCYGYPKIGFFSSLASNAINAFLTYAAMFLLKVDPRMIVYWMGGITLFSEGIKALIVCLFFVRKRVPMSFRCDLGQIRELLRLGFPASIANVAYNLSQVITGAILVGLGDDVYKTKQYVSQVVYFVYLMGYAIGQANAIMIGREYGMDDKERADRMHRQNLRIVVLLNITLSFLFALCAQPIMKWLFNANDAILRLSHTIFFIDIIVEGGRGMNHVGQNGLNAVGDVLFTTIVSVVSCWACSVGLSYLFAVVLPWGLPGMWCAFAIDELFRGMLYYIRWRSGKWKRHSFNGDEPAHDSLPTGSETGGRGGDQ